MDPCDGDNPRPNNNIATTIVFIINGINTNIQAIIPRLFLQSESNKYVIITEITNLISDVIHHN